MGRHPVHNVIHEKVSGYIKREILQEFLKGKWPSSLVEDFDIKVGSEVKT